MSEETLDEIACGVYHPISEMVEPLRSTTSLALKRFPKTFEGQFFALIDTTPFLTLAKVLAIFLNIPTQFFTAPRAMLGPGDGKLLLAIRTLENKVCSTVRTKLSFVP